MGQIKYKIDGVMKKQATIKQSMRNVNRTFQLQADLADIESKLDEMSVKEQAEATIKNNHRMNNYLADVLNLDEDEKDSLEDLEIEEVTEHMSYLTRRIMGQTDEEIKAEAEKAEQEEGLKNE